MRKLLVLGHAQHGKDTVADYLAFNMVLTNIPASKFIVPHLMEGVMSMDYNSKEECWADRINRREEWGDEIAEYNRVDKARLARLVFKDSDIYTGVRRQDELDSIIVEFDPIIIWVDATGRVQQESPRSMQIRANPNWINVTNIGQEWELLGKCIHLASWLQEKYSE